MIVNDLPDGAGKDFQVHWNVQDWDTWQADLRNPGVTYYEILVSSFTSRIHNAKWRQDVTH